MHVALFCGCKNNRKVIPNVLNLKGVEIKKIGGGYFEINMANRLALSAKRIQMLLVNKQSVFYFDFKTYNIPVIYLYLFIFIYLFGQVSK